VAPQSSPDLPQQLESGVYVYKVPGLKKTHELGEVPRPPSNFPSQ